MAKMRDELKKSKRYSKKSGDIITIQQKHIDDYEKYKNDPIKFYMDHFISIKRDNSFVTDKRVKKITKILNEI
jgi:hypothetical protein